MAKVVVLHSFPHELGYEKLMYGQREDIEFIISVKKAPEDIIPIIHDADVILFNDVTFDKTLLDSLQKCRLIIRYGIGYDNIDIKYAAEKGIIVCNAPNYGVIDVAEHAISLLLACAKRLVYMNDCVRDNFWTTGAMGQSVRLAGKKVGFLGFGKIARCVCQRTNAFDTKAIVYDPFVDEASLAQFNATSVDLDTLLRESDYISLHLPLNPHTKHMINMDAFRKMKKSAIIINTSRGGIIHEADLIDALEQGLIAGAGLDVFEDETGKLDKRILSHKMVTLTPHVAWNTVEGAEALHKEVTDNVLRFLDGNRPESIVNGL